MSDIGHEQTDKELKKLEKKITQEYQKATKEVEKKMNDYLSKFAKKDKEMAKKVKNGEITSQEYAEWRQNQMLTGKRWEQMRDTLAQDLVNADKIAAGMINDTLPDAYALNFNYGTYEVESGAEINTSFTLYDHDTVERLMREDPKIIPKARIDIPKDQLWNRQKITSAVTQGILQGESIDKIAKRLGKVTDMDRNAAIRNARTYTTAAENGGRIDSYERANKQGIQVNKMWMATLDDRTRYEHRHLDGMSVPNDEPFEIDGYKIDYPGDPDAEPEMIYNCRCTLVADIKGIDYNDERNDSKLGEMTYDEWKHALDKRVAPGGTEEDEATNTTTEEEKANVEPNKEGIVEGKDLTEIWERREKEFDYAIDDIVDAQGFNGKPQLATPEEFKQAVEESGIVMRRIYSTDDQETLDAYREALYKGEFYVDAKRGAAFGHGMYTASGTVDELDGIAKDMDFYKTTAAEHYIETMTITPDAKVADYEELQTELVDIANKYYHEDPNSEESKFWNDLDLGDYAALKGYDAIHVPQEWSETDADYTVVLNRTKLVILENPEQVDINALLTADETQKEKPAAEEKTGDREIIEGRDITKSWTRREDKFDFAIDDIVDAQGFNGLPKIATDEEFDKAVKESNIILQRGYRGDSTEILDGYRDQLYNGEWYVDCSVGGTVHGSGMYVMYDEGTQISERTKEAVDFYAGNNIQLGYKETMTLDPSAKIITRSEAFEMMDNLSEVKDSIYSTYVDEALNKYNLTEEEKNYYRVRLFNSEQDFEKTLEASSWYGDLPQDKKEKLDEFMNEKLAEQKATITEKIAGLNNLDIGTIAALKGYDAIKVENGEMVILNRTKVIIKRANND